MLSWERAGAIPEGARGEAEGVWHTGDRPMPKGGRRGRTRRGPRAVWYIRERCQLMLTLCQAPQTVCETKREMLLTSMLWVTTRWRTGKHWH